MKEKIKIQNIVLAITLNLSSDIPIEMLPYLNDIFKTEQIIYNEFFTGAIWKFPTQMEITENMEVLRENVTFLIFRRGKVIIAGIKKPEKINKYIEILKKFFEENYKKDLPKLLRKRIKRIKEMINKKKLENKDIRYLEKKLKYEFTNYVANLKYYYALIEACKMIKRKKRFDNDFSKFFNKLKEYFFEFRDKKLEIDKAIPFQFKKRIEKIMKNAKEKIKKITNELKERMKEKIDYWENYLINEIKNAKIEIKDVEIVNIIVSYNFDKKLDIERMVFELSNKYNVELEPDVFPGAIIRKNEPKIIFLVFRGGYTKELKETNASLICSGAKDIETAEKETLKMIKELEPYLIEEK